MAETEKKGEEVEDGMAIKLTPEELRFIMEYRKLSYGKVVMTKHNGQFSGGETIASWDRSAVNPTRILREDGKRLTNPGP